MTFDLTADRAEAYNERAEELPDAVDHPCLRPQLVHRDSIEANDYNPNKVTDPELDLLEKSIREDGMTMPIVTYRRADGTYEIVDGFHRYLVLTGRLDEEWVPVSVIDKDIDERMSSTVRHNRARGDHTTELMGDLVKSMENEGMDTEGIADELGMETEEIVRLKQVIGASKMLASDQYGQSWGVQEGDDPDADA